MKKIIICFLTFFATNVFADSNITVYNNGLALISQSQKTNLSQGKQKVYFNNISEQLKPQSAMVSGLDIKVLEKNYSYNLINSKNVLNEFIGKEVNAITTNPQTGRDIIKKAVLVANNYGKPVLRFNYGLEFDFNGRVAVADVPKGFSPTPIFEVLLEAKNTKEAILDLTYLSTGLSWSANYIATLNKDMLEISAWADINNNTGTDFNNAAIKVVAGDIKAANIYSRGYADQEAQPLMMAKSAMGANYESNKAKPVGDYYYYDFANKISLKNNTSKQINLFEKNNVSFKKEYKFVSPLSISTYASSQNIEKTNPQVLYKIANDKKEGLGILLPAGDIKFYENNGSYKTFIGEANITHSAIGETLELAIGHASDYYAKAKILNVNKISKNVSQLDAEITFYNSKSNDQEVFFEQNIRGEWKILEQNIPSSKKDASSAIWQIMLPANSNKTLSFKVRVEN